METIAYDHLMAVYDEIVAFVKIVLQNITSDEHVLVEFLEITATCFHSRKAVAEEEL